MSKLKPCPFCGSSNVATEKSLDLAYCDNCCAESNDDVWNTRPIEDALRAQLAARDTLIERLVGVAEIKFRTSMPMNEQAIEYGGKWQKLVAEYRASKESVE